MSAASVSVQINAIDNYSKEFHKAAKAAGRGAELLRSAYSKYTDLSNQKKQLSALKKSYTQGTSKISQYTQSLVENREKMRQLTLAVQAHHSPTKRMLAQKAKMHKTTNSLQEKLQAERKALASVRQEMHKTGTTMKNFADQQAALQQRVDAAKSSLDSQAKYHADLKVARDKRDSRLMTASSLSFVGDAAVRTGRGALSFVSSPFQAALQLDNAMQDVDKFVKGANIKQLRKQIMEAGNESTLGAVGMARLVAEAGKTGLQGDEAFQSAKITEMASVAFDVPLEIAAERNNKMRASMALSLDGLAELNDAINYFGDNTSSTADGVSNVVTRVGGVAKVAGFASSEIAGLAAMMDSIAPNSQTAATALKNVSNTLMMGDATRGQAKDAYERLGLDPAQIAKNMAVDATGTLDEVLTKIAELSSDEQGAIIPMLFGKESQAVVAGMVTNMDEYRQIMADAADASKLAGSTTKEYNRTMHNIETQLN